MLNLLFEHWQWAAMTAALLLAVIVFAFSGTWMIAAYESGLVVKRFGPPLVSGRIIALAGRRVIRRACCRRAGTSASGAGATA